uniref:Uncharacterized protein n=1 Tax=Cyanothece sp. (strain PCC 7425 / ATCC 29141) TaxID=395961 RepID=B8HSH2_CYAP4
MEYLININLVDDQSLVPAAIDDPGCKSEAIHKEDGAQLLQVRVEKWVKLQAKLCAQATPAMLVIFETQASRSRQDSTLSAATPGR